MLNVQYSSPSYKNNIKEIDSQEGFGFGRENSLNPNFKKIVSDHPERIQRVMLMHGIRLTLEECVGLYHSWSQSRYAAGWMSTIDDMTDDDLYKVMSTWLVELATDNINRLTDIVNEAFNSRV